MTSETFSAEIDRNIRIHDRLARRYEELHGEIFNDAEQSRLHAALGRAAAHVSSEGKPLQALDFGCGSGNLTRHMLQLGMQVTAADVSQGFLDLVKSRYPQARTLLLANGDLSAVDGDAFDFLATYSVLHHVPDYLGACAQLARMCRKGGVVFIDHEASEDYWRAGPEYAAFVRQAARLDWRKYLSPANYMHRLRRVFHPRHSNEGDIHVWPDDHIEWPRIRELFRGLGFEVILEETYLLHRKSYRREIYEQFAGRLTDTQVMAFRKVN